MSLLSPASGGGALGLRRDDLRVSTGDAAFVPCLRLTSETVLTSGDGEENEREAQVPVLSLTFDYGGTSVRASDPRQIVMDARSGEPITRDRAGEMRARYLLESFGAVELDCVDDVSAMPGSQADYLVRADEDVHELCSFSAYVLPQLKALGWRVQIASGYRYQLVEHDVPWYAKIDPEDDQPDWFSLELGIEIDGKRINLLPALLDMLERSPDAAGLDGVVPRGARCFAIPVSGGRYLPVPPERLRMVFKVIRELYDENARRRQNVRFPQAQAASLAQIDAALGSEGRPVRWEGATKVRDRGQALAAGPARVINEPPPGLKATLRPYQQEGLSWLQHLRAHDVGGVLADDMGLGKTLQTIAHLVAERAAGRLDRPALVIAPTSLIGNWRREINKFAPHLRVLVLQGPRRHLLFPQIDRAHVVLMTYGAMVRDEERLAERLFHMLILDEAQAIKNPRSLAQRALKSIQARHKLCLSGTPVENSLIELWSYFDLLMPGLLGDEDWFRHRFVTPIERDGNGERMRALREQVAPFILRRTKEEVATDLPPKTIIVRPVDLRGPQRDLYESLRVAAHAEVRQAISRKGLGGSAIAILDALMKLRQACCDPRLLSGETARDVRTSAKYDMLMELLDQQLASGRRVLVFSQFAQMLRLIGEGLDGKGIPFVTLTGATSDRQKPVDAFEGRKVAVFLISLKAGGTGLNLTSADTVVHYDPWWNPAAQAQATDRAHRIGQTRPVFVYNLIVAGSVEERMLRLQRRKQMLANGLLGREQTGGFSLSEQDVDGLFAPLVEDDTQQPG